MDINSTEGTMFKKAVLAANSLSLYRKLLYKEPFKMLLDLCFYISDNNFDIIKAVNLYSSLFYLLSENSHDMISLKEYVLDELLYDENAFSKECEKKRFEDMDGSILEAALNDLCSLQTLALVSSNEIKERLNLFVKNDYQKVAVDNLPSYAPSLSLSNSKDPANTIKSVLNISKDWCECIEDLHGFYSINGSGIFAKYKAFVWERLDGKGMLRGVENPDRISMDDLIGYTLQRDDVRNNTIKFLKGFPANNMLLYGDRGTGKSSTVKAVLNEFASQGLRLVEVPKCYLSDFTDVTRILASSPHKFIVFVDDLVLEDNEENYTALKAALEGGVEARPSNVVVYATSNRRHLIREKFSDRMDSDEVRASDTMQEKLSLSDRFGMTVVFSSPGKKDYLELVEGIVKKRGLSFDREYLHAEALKWELYYNGRSPRTARQFVDWLEGQT
ncbi:MAG TPA: ATP-binding protein [Clostridia bacterium]